MREKRGLTDNKTILKAAIILAIIIITTVLITQNKKTVGLAIYNFGTFDNATSLGSWQEGGNNNEGTYNIDTQTYYGGNGSLKGTMIGANKTWFGETVSQKLPTNLTQNGEYLNFYWRKSYSQNQPINNNMTITLLRPDGTIRTIWSDESTNNNDAWNHESVQINYFNQQGEYYLVLACNMKSQEGATNNTTTDCWFDEITIDTQAQGGSGGAINYPIFYSYTETPITPIYNTTTIYDFRVSISDTDGKPWIELDGTNRSLTQVSGNTYKYTISNLTATIHSFYYWTWNSGSINNRARNSSEMRTYKINKTAGEVKTIINGYRGDMNAINGTQICFSAIAPEYENGQRTITVNGQLWGNQSANFQNCTTFIQPQTINITTMWDGGINYYPDTETAHLRIIKESETANYTATKIAITSPTMTEYSSDTKEIELSITTNSEMRECSYSINGQESQQLQEINKTKFSKKIKATAGEYELLFICLDNFGTAYNSQLTKYKIKEAPRTGTMRNETETLQINNESCPSEWKCTDWSSCSATSYDPSEIISGKIEVRGEERRICYDTKLCQNSRIERRICELKIPIRATIKNWCEQNYIEIYDLSNNQLVSRIKEKDLGQNKKADIGFVTGISSDYCDYCYNDIKDYDEAGIDCGGKNCPACNNKGVSGPVSPNKLRIALIIIQIMVVGAIVSYLFYWLIIGRLWSKEEDEEINNPEIRTIREALKKGYNKEQIKGLLKKKGWSEKQIEEIINKALQ